MNLPNDRGESSFLTDLVELRPSGNRIGLFSRVDIVKGSRILPLTGPLRSRPTRYSIQLGEELHLDAGGNIDDELNHSCDASARMDLETMTLVAIRAISRGEEITINYCATEYVLNHPFTCDCRSECCYGYIRGFRFLKREQRIRIQNELSPYLKQYFDSADCTQDAPHRRNVE
jgi:SET domain